jgi:predicted O-methyltransferase YrrM
MKFTTSPFLYKLNYLIKHKANFAIILSFFKFQTCKPFFNHFRSKQKKIYKKIIKDKLITSDFFSLNAFDWKKNLKKYKNKNVKYLEIGSFEGISAFFINKHLKLKEIHCVDTWEGSPEHDEIDFKNIELNFDNNIKNIENLYKYKETSDDFFIKNKENFDIIYVDGLHEYSQVKKDLINVLKFLNPDGIIICDDYLWNLDANKADIPVQAINEVVSEYNLKIKAITANQIFLTR